MGETLDDSSTPTWWTEDLSITMVTTTADLQEELMKRAGNTTSCVFYDLFMRIGVHGFLIVFGTIGNLLTMQVLYKEHLKSPTFFTIFYLH